MSADRVLTPERFATGMTFDQYLEYIGTPASLAREAGWWRGPERMDWTGPLRFLRDWGAMQRSPFFKVWASAAIDEMLSALYEQRILGALPDPCRA
ncbi:MAG: hypothetical protein WEG40_12905 [Candidatus Rokuibacteriota bacterium]